jgi:small-conductance mechanosensitive channel
LQKVASNLISGFIILLDRSIKPGDVISVGNTFGWITSLRARYVSVNTREGVEYLIPNETFVTDKFVNLSYSDRSIRLEIKFGVSYASDPHMVRKLAVDTVKNLLRILHIPEPVCHMVAFGDSSLDFVLRFWIQDPEHGVSNIRGDCFLALWDEFKQHGIQIPYPHREVLVRREGDDFRH